MTVSAPAAQERGLAKTDGFDAVTTTRSAETAQAAAAEQARAVVQARFTMALHRPRDFDQARLDILKACRRPVFAEKARYRKPQAGAKSCGRDGCSFAHREECGFLCGLSIRSADEFAKFYGNIQTEQTTLYDDGEQRVIGVAATDLEHNITKAVTLTIRKTVERKFSRGRTVIERRENSKGEEVLLLRATDDEVTQKEGIACAKARRNLLLQLIPADVLEESEDAILETVRAGNRAVDPDKLRKKIVDHFAALGVKPSELEKLLRHGLDAITPAEVEELGLIKQALIDGEAKWSDFVSSASADDDAATPARHNPTVDALRKKAEEAKRGKSAKAAEAPAEPASEDGRAQALLGEMIALYAKGEAHKKIVNRALQNHGLGEGKSLRETDFTSADSLEALERSIEQAQRNIAEEIGA